MMQTMGTAEARSSVMVMGAALAAESPEAPTKNGNSESADAPCR